jgi:hypothetical protein
LEKKDLGLSDTLKYTLEKDRTKCAVRQRKYNNKVLIIGDSLGKKSAAELRIKLDHCYEIMGFTKPGAQMREILETAVEEVALLSKKDILVLWAGANDISKNNTNEALKSLMKFMERHKRLNIFLINAQHRHDLINTSCVNEEVIKCNRQVKKIIKLHSNAKLMEVELQRQLFTRQGQHLNLLGIEIVASELAKNIKQLTKVETNPIQMKWTEDNQYGEYSSALNEIGELISTNNYSKSVESRKSRASVNLRLQEYKEGTVHKEASSEKYKKETVHKETAESQGNEADETSVDPSPNSVAPLEGKQHQKIRM